ncbi:MAG: hypothetical protein AUK47_02860 [Deltaproteobacteria bacterium CG2_30_63_29]|nr:MAG: hypothetical protein AUK47_02860 [Deltaproteobacteria bacterium CG2_30_63_29]
MVVLHKEGRLLLGGSIDLLLRHTSTPAMKIAGLVRLATRHFLWNQGAIQRFRLTTENTESTEE